MSDERLRHRDHNEIDGRYQPSMSPRSRRAFAHAALICAAVLAPQDAMSREPSPPQTVYAVMVDCSRALRIVTGLESCRVIERSADGKWDVREHIISISFLLPRVRNVFRSEYDQDRRIRFRRVGGDLRLSDGEWHLQPLAGGTRVTYGAHVALSAPVPGLLVREAIRYDLPNTLIALRRESLEGRRK